MNKNKIQIKDSNGDWHYLIGSHTVGSDTVPQITDDPEKGLPRNLKSLSDARDVLAVCKADLPNYSLRLQSDEQFDAIYAMYLKTTGASATREYAYENARYSLMCMSVIICNHCKDEVERLKELLPALLEPGENVDVFLERSRKAIET